MVRPQAICISLTVKPAVGPGRILDLDTDLAFAGEAWSWVGDALPLVTTGSVLEPYELEHLMRAGFFTATDDADSRERQCTDFEQEALHIATRLLCTNDEARVTSIANAVSRELFWLIPHEVGAEISIRDRTVTVTPGEAAVEAVHHRVRLPDLHGRRRDRRGRHRCVRPQAHRLHGRDRLLAHPAFAPAA